MNPELWSPESVLFSILLPGKKGLCSSPGGGGATTVWTKKPGLSGMQLFLNVRKLEHHTSARLGWCPSSRLGSEDTYFFSSPRPPWASPCVNQGFQTGEGKLQMGQEPSLGGPARQAQLFEQPSSRLTTALTPEQRNFI